MKKWILLHPQEKKHINLDNESISKILLENRGIFSKDQRDEFFNPHLSQLTLESAGIDKNSSIVAFSRIQKAISRNESIVVYTDYDVDGICSGTIMWETLYKLGARVMPYVPHRMKEGYGLSNTGIENVKNQFNPQLIITVDHGISAFEQIEYAKKLGIDIIIIDHHILAPQVPDAYAIIHTTKLCATGIVLLFCSVLKEYLKFTTLIPSLTSLSENLDLASFATVADLVPLTGLNRIIAKVGIQELKKTQRIGLIALIKEAQIAKEDIDVYKIGHILAPRINAIGRLKHAIDALRLLCTKDKHRAELLAEDLSIINKKRQKLSKESLNFAMQMIHDDVSYQKLIHQKRNKIIVLSHVSFSEGVMGLIAGRLVEEFYLPVIIISEKDMNSKASARSIMGYDIVKSLRELSDLLINIGGHPMAAGFTIETKKIEIFKQRLSAKAATEIHEELLQKPLNIDLQIAFENINKNLIKEIQNLSPFGIGNPEPVFATSNVRIKGIKFLGHDQKHIKLRLSHNESIHDGIGFNLGYLYSQLSVGSYIDIAYSPQENKWNNIYNLQLNIRDVKISC